MQFALYKHLFLTKKKKRRQQNNKTGERHTTNTLKMNELFLI